MKTALAFIIFNRPAHTEQVLERIRELRPPALYVIADGPRTDRPGEKALCQETQDLVLKSIDWPCEVRSLISGENLGCARRVSSGLDWVFGREDTAIILEDDCVVDPSFVPFAETLLQRHAQDPQIMAISAARFAEWDPAEPDLAYTQSAYFHCWGWATWRRAWQHFQFNLENWRERCSPIEIRALLGSLQQQRYWTYTFDRTHRRKNSWAFRYQLSCWEKGGFTLVPKVNLAENIGFDETATHTLPGCDNPCTEAGSLELPQDLPPITPRNQIYEAKVASSLKLDPLAKRAALKLSQKATALTRSLFHGS